MPHTIQLTTEHQIILLESLVASLNDKLFFVDQAKHQEINRQYEDAATKLLEPVRIFRRDKSLPTWLKDQLLHSTGVKHTELIQRAIIILDAMIENRYAEFCQSPIVE